LRLLASPVTHDVEDDSDEEETAFQGYMAIFSLPNADSDSDSEHPELVESDDDESDCDQPPPRTLDLVLRLRGGRGSDSDDSDGDNFKDSAPAVLVAPLSSTSSALGSFFSANYGDSDSEDSPAPLYGPELPPPQASSSDSTTQSQPLALSADVVGSSQGTATPSGTSGQAFASAPTDTSE
jgi:hypothetical protein